MSTLVTLILAAVMELLGTGNQAVFSEPKYFSPEDQMQEYCMPVEDLFFTSPIKNC